MGSKKKPPYDAEFREGAVRIVVETGRSAGDVAEELGINPGTLHSAAGGLPPEEFERTITEARKKSDQRCQAA